MRTLPDVDGALKLEPGSATDVLGLVLGFIVLCVTAWVAWRQFRILKKQTAMMEEQAAGAIRQEAIALEQVAESQRLAALTLKMADILTAQGEIAKKQDRIMSEQLARRSQLMLECRRGAVENPGLLSRTTKYELLVRNYGNKACSQFRWRLHIPSEFMELFRFEAGTDIHHPTSTLPTDGFIITGIFDKPVFPSEDLIVIRFEMLKMLELPGKGTRMAWSIASEDGSVLSGLSGLQDFHFFQEQMFQLPENI